MSKSLDGAICAIGSPIAVNQLEAQHLLLELKVVCKTF